MEQEHFILCYVAMELWFVAMNQFMFAFMVLSLALRSEFDSNTDLTVAKQGVSFIDLFEKEFRTDIELLQCK